jgi:hypothetical protein
MVIIIFLKSDSSIVLKPGPAQRVDLGLEPGRVDEKIEKVMTRPTRRVAW